MRKFMRVLALPVAGAFMTALAACGDTQIPGSVSVGTDGISVSADPDAITKQAFVTVAGQLGFPNLKPEAVQRDTAGNYNLITSVQNCPVTLQYGQNTGLKVTNIGTTANPTEAQLGITLDAATTYRDLQSQLSQAGVRRQLGCPGQK